MLHPLTSVELTLCDAPLDFAAHHKSEIEAYWARILAPNDRLWNGPFFLFTGVVCAGGVLSAQAHATDYATFLYWRDHGRDASAVHVTGTSLPVTADGKLLAARMAAHTANPGQIYFPAGSLDDTDLVGGRFDLTGNIRRELAEETGLRPTEAAFDPYFVAHEEDNAWFIARRCWLTQTADQCAALFGAHQSETGDDEADALIAIDGPMDAAQLKPYARALAMWHFAGDQTRT